MAYLAAYFHTLVSSPSQEVLRLTLIDGFVGGGLYLHKTHVNPSRVLPLLAWRSSRNLFIPRMTLGDKER